jgi:hypothetical protein
MPDPEAVVRAVLSSWGQPPYVISCGDCDVFAEVVRESLPGSKVLWLDELPGKFEHIAHAVLLFAGKYYDAENPEGVADPGDLKIVKHSCDTAYHERMHREYGVMQV